MGVEEDKDELRLNIELDPNHAILLSVAKTADGQTMVSIFHGSGSYRFEDSVEVDDFRDWILSASAVSN